MRISEAYRQFGGGIVSRIAKSLFRRIGIGFETFYLFQCEINVQTISAQMKNYDYTDVCEINAEDFFLSPLFSAEKKQLFIQRLESGNYSCYGIKRNKELIYSTWISWKYMNYPAIFKKIESLLPGEALLEDSFCHPDYRGKGFHLKMNFFRMHKIYERGNSRVLALVLKENTPAIKVQLKSGLGKLKKIHVWKTGNTVKIKEILLND